MLAEVGAAVVGAEVGGDGECQSFCSIDDVVGGNKFDDESGG